MPKCKLCGHVTVTLSMLSDHNCDSHNEDCPEYEDE